MTTKDALITAILVIIIGGYGGVGVLVYRKVRSDGKSRIRSFLYGLVWLDVLLTFGSDSYARTFARSNPLRQRRKR